MGPTEGSNPPPADPDVDGADDTAGGDRQRVCRVWTDQAPLQGVPRRYHCSGNYTLNTRASVDIDFEEVEQEALDMVADPGVDQIGFFGPNWGATFDDPAVIACCEDDYDYAFTPLPEDEDAEHGWACAVDCLDQMCRAVPETLRDLRDGEFSENPGVFAFALKHLPAGCGVTGHCYDEQLTALANYISEHHDVCVVSFNNEEVPQYTYQPIALGGIFDLDAYIAAEDPNAAEAWPALGGVVVDGKCGVDGPDTVLNFSGWQPPPGPAQPCTDASDNNDEGPPQSGRGGGFHGPDTFVVSEGRLELRGPSNFMGLADVGGRAPMVGARDTNCLDQTCTWLSASTRNGIFTLHDLHVEVPPNLRFQQGANALLLDDFRLYTDGTQAVPLSEVVPGTFKFEFPVDSLKAIASGRLYGIPIHAEVRNTTGLIGIVVQQATGTFSVVTDPVTFGLVDVWGNPWNVEISFGSWIGHERAPRAVFDITHVGEHAYLDAGASSDGDGDRLEFKWYVDGAAAGVGAQVRVGWAPGDSHIVVLDVTDATGRSDRAVRMSAHAE